MDSKHHTEGNVKHEEQHATNARKRFAVVCQSKPAKTVQSIQQDHSQNGGYDDPQTSYNFNQVTWKLDQVSTNSPAPQQPNEYNTKVTIRVQDQRLKVQVDSGAEVNIIDHNTYRNLSRKPQLHSTNAKLKPYGSKPIPVKGYFRATVRANGRQVNTTFYVTAETSAALIIGKYTAFDLDILKISVNELLQQPARKQTSTPSQRQSPQEIQIPALAIQRLHQLEISRNREPRYQ